MHAFNFQHTYCLVIVLFPRLSFLYSQHGPLLNNLCMQLIEERLMAIKETKLLQVLESYALNLASDPVVLQPTPSQVRTPSLGSTAALPSSPSEVQQNESGGSGGISIAPIIGAAAGGIVAVVAAFAGFAIWRKRRRTDAAQETLTRVSSDIPAPTFPSAPAASRPAAYAPSQGAATDYPTTPRGTLFSSAPFSAASDPFISSLAVLRHAGIYRRPSSAASESLAGYELDFDELAMVRPIGEGSFGRVYLADYRGSQVAVKVLLDTQGGLLADPTAQQRALSASAPIIHRLHEEAAIVAGMDHPNVVRLVGICNAPPCTVSEFCERGSLIDVLRAATELLAAAAELTWARRLSMVSFHLL
jgi:hypothetical protein